MKITTIILTITALLFSLASAEEVDVQINRVPLLIITGDPGDRVEIQYSSDMGNTDPWTVLETVTILESPTYYSDVSAFTMNAPRRFYRLETVSPTNDILSFASETVDPRSSLLRVEEDVDSDFYLVYSIQLDALGADAIIQDFTITFENGETTTSLLSDMINDVEVRFDGDHTNNYRVVSNDNGTQVLAFEDNVGDFSINDGDSADLQVRVEFDQQSGNYENGSSLLVSEIVINYIDEYGNPGVLTNFPQGNSMNITTHGLLVTFLGGSSTDIGSDRGHFNVGFRVRSFGDDHFVSFVDHEVLDENDEVVTTTTLLADNLDTSAPVSGSLAAIPEGSSAGFALDIVLDNDGVPGPQDLKVKLSEITFRVGSPTGDEVKQYIFTETIETPLLTLGD